MSFENHKRSENAPEVIQEGIKFKKFGRGEGGGGMPQTLWPTFQIDLCNTVGQNHIIQ